MIRSRAPLATFEELVAFMRLPADTIDEDQASKVLVDASAMVREELRQNLDYTVDDIWVTRLNGGRCLLLPELPVLEVTEVAERFPGGAWATLTPDIDYEVDLDLTGTIWRLGREWPGRHIRGPGGQIQVTYSHGWGVPGNLGPAAPNDIARLPQIATTTVCRVAARGYVNPEAAAVAVAGRSSTTFGFAGSFGTPGLYLSKADKADLDGLRRGGRGGSR